MNGRELRNGPHVPDLDDTSLWGCDVNIGVTVIELRTRDINASEMHIVSADVEAGGHCAGGPGQGPSSTSSWILHAASTDM